MVKHWRLLMAYLFLMSAGVAFRWPSMSYSLLEAHYARQTYTAMMVREYMTGGLWQLSPLPLFGPPWQLPHEFPLFQWLAAVGGLVTGADPQIASRLAALGFFLITAVFAAHLAHRWFGRAAGLITMALFMFVPFAYQWGNAPLIEFLATAGALLAVIATDRWVNKPRIVWLGVATVGWSVSFLVKPFTAMVMVLLAVAVAAKWERAHFIRVNLKRSLTGIPVLIGLILGLVWTSYANAYKASDQYMAWLTTDALAQWYYGTLDQRLTSVTWQFIVMYSEAIFGSIVIFGALIALAFIRYRSTAIIAALALALPVGAVIATNVYYMHNYYQAAVLPQMLMVMAAGIAAAASLARTRVQVIATSMTLTLLIIVTSWLSDEGKLISERTPAGLYTFPLVDEINEVVPSGAGLIMAGCDWDSAYLYLANRPGLMLRDDKLGEQVPSEWIPDDHGYLALCREGIDPKGFLPPSVVLQQLSPSVFRLYQ